MIDFEGDLSLLLRLKRREGRIGILGLSGGNRGALGCAQAVAAEERGLTKNPALLSGVSTFSGVVKYIACGTLRKGWSCYWEECTWPEFISFSLRRFLQGLTMNVGFLIPRFERENSTQGLMAFPGKTLVAVTDWLTGRGELVDLKTTSPGPYTAILASMAVPIIYRLPVWVNGRRKCDGGIGHPFPAVEVIGCGQLSGLIVFANRRRGAEVPLKVRLMDACGALFLPPKLGWAVLTRHARFQKGLRKLRECGVPYLIFYNSGDIGVFTRDPATIQRHAEKAYEDMLQLIDSVGI